MSSTIHKLLPPIVFLLVGGANSFIGLRGIRHGEITLGRGKKRLYTRRDHPVDFWGFSLWFTLVGALFLVVGAIALVRVVVG